MGSLKRRSGASSSRAFKSASLLNNAAHLRSTRARSAILSQLPSRRGFATTPAAAGWLPTFGFGSSSPAPATPPPPSNEHAPIIDPASTAGAAPFQQSSPSLINAIPSPALADAVPPPTVSETVPVESVATHVIEGVNHTLISTGTLDLTSLASSWGLHPIMRLQSMFLQLHEAFPLVGHGLPWYILIPTVTLGLRLLLFGFQVRAQANGARMANIQPEMMKGMATLKAAKARGDFVGAQAAQMATAKLMSDHKVNPLKNLVFPLAQASVFMTMFFAIRGLATAELPSLHTEGLGWVADLTASDPYYILPVASTALTLASLEFGIDTTTQVQTTTTKNMKLFFRVGLLGALPFIAYFPAALLLYWTTNNALSLFQALLLKQHSVRAFFGIPATKPKAQPGEPGYIAEPSFSEAFKNMQVGAREQWEATKESTEKEHKRKQDWASQGAGAPEAAAYVPRAAAAPKRMGEVERVSGGLNGGLTEAAEMVEAVQGSARSGAQPIQAEARLTKEEEKARRVFEARQRRMKK